jgi:hypothetical protein
MMLDRPLLQSYWVLPDRLLAGEYPAAGLEESTRRQMDAFLEDGFNTFIDLTIPDELPPYFEILAEQARAYQEEIRYQRFPIGDFGVPSQATMKAILDAIDAALAEGRKVYVHCWGGVGRTGTSVGCYLIRHGLSGEQALAQLAEWWQNVPKSHYYPDSPETDEQAQFILDWEEVERPSRQHYITPNAG